MYIVQTAIVIYLYMYTLTRYTTSIVPYRKKGLSLQVEKCKRRIVINCKLRTRIK